MITVSPPLLADALSRALRHVDESYGPETVLVLADGGCEVPDTDYLLWLPAPGAAGPARLLARGGGTRLLVLPGLLEICALLGDLLG